MLAYHHDATLAETRDTLARNRDEGVTTCPCCGTRLADQEIHLDRSLIEQLKWFVENHSGGKWVDVALKAPRWMIRRRSFNRLRYFGLLQKKDYTTKLSPDKRGMWRLTMSGFKFVDGVLWVPEWVKVREGRVIDKADKLIGVQVALQTEVVEV